MPSRAIIPDDPGFRDEGHRVVKLSCSKLAQGNQVLVNVIEAMTIKNAQLAVRGSILLNNMVMMCVSENIPIPKNFMHQSFLAHALNWNLASNLDQIKDLTLRNVIAGTFVYDENDSRQVDPATRFVIPDDNSMLGNGWLVDNLITMFTTNIRVAIKAKWKAFINDSIETFKQINELDKYSNVPKEMKRLIYNPTKQPMSGAPHPLTLEAWKLIEFHRQGFQVHGTDENLDDAYFEDESLYHHHVFHFGKCLERQCELEQQHDQSFPKRLPLPMCSMGQRNSIQIDKKGLYWILREMEKQYTAMGRFPVRLSAEKFDTLVSQQRQFNDTMYWDWIHRLFRINKVVTGNKVFSKTGIGLTTDGVQVSVHYYKYMELNPDAKRKPIRSVRARVNAKRRARVTNIVRQRYKPKKSSNAEEIMLPQLKLYCDPGRSNILYIHIRDEEGMLIKVMVLTRRHYYDHAKINAVIRRSNEWNNSNEMKDLINGLSENHFKHACPVQFEAAIIHYRENFDRIWQLKAVAKKWSRQKLFLHGSKRSVVAKFLSKLKLRGYQNPVMYYGSGTFPAGQKGEQYAPCKWVKNKCKEFFQCITINEFRTSQICPNCNTRLFDVCKLNDEGKKKSIRGLKWCDDPSCAHCPLKSRDEVGTINIFLKSKDEYPDCYDRPTMNPDGTVERGVKWVAGPQKHVLGVKK